MIYFEAMCLFLVLCKLDVSFEFIQEFIFFFAFDNCIVEIIHHSFIVLRPFDAKLGCLFVLQVCFAIQVLGLDVAHTFWQR